MISTKNDQGMVQFKNFQEQSYTLERTARMANFSLFAPEKKEKQSPPVSPAPMSHSQDKTTDDALQFENSLFKNFKQITASKPFGSHTITTREPNGPHTHTKAYSHGITRPERTTKFQSTLKLKFTGSVFITFSLDRFHTWSTDETVSRRLFSPTQRYFRQA